MDFIVELSNEVEIETSSRANDCVTWGTGGCDDD